MADSGAVAGMLWEHWVPRSVRRAVAEALPGGADDAERLVRFLAAAHDTGKATPAFACQVEQLADAMRQVGLDMPTAKQFGESRRLAPHGLAGQLLLQEWMRERFGFAPRAAGQFAVVAGGHHGTPPDTQQIHDLQFRPHLLRHTGPSEAAWRRVQYELMDGCAELAGVQNCLPAWVDVRLPQPVQVLLTALVILSDWMASSPELFPYAPESWHPLGPVGERRRLHAAWQGLDLPAPWAPENPVSTAEELFAGRFPHLAGKAAIRPVQAEVARVAREMAPGGLRWTPQQTGAFLDFVAQDRLYAMWHLIAFRGLRRGEACGQPWSETNLDTHSLTVSSQLVQDGWEIEASDPKTDSGYRVVSLDDDTVEVLKQHRERQDADHKEWGSAWVETGHVFTQEDGTWLHPGKVTDLFERLIATSGLPPIRLHDLRHGAATLMLAADIDIKIVSDTLGHSDTRITRDIYQSVLPQVGRSAAEATAKLVPLQRKAEAEKAARKAAKRERAMKAAAKNAGKAKGGKPRTKAKAQAKEAVKAKHRKPKK